MPVIPIDVVEFTFKKKRPVQADMQKLITTKIVGIARTGREVQVYFEKTPTAAELEKIDKFLDRFVRQPGNRKGKLGPDGFIEG